MGLALQEAEKAFLKGEVPVGAVVVHQEQPIGWGHNQVECLQDPTAHAEMLALKAASMALASRRLLGCTLYVTLEPCAMCAGALIQARISRLVYAASEPRSGAIKSIFQLLDNPILNHRVEVTSGILAEQSANLLKAFFRTKRLRQKNK